MDHVSLEKFTVRPFHKDDKALVTAFFDQMGGETRAFFNVNDANRNAAMKFFDGAMENTALFLAEHGGRWKGTFRCGAPKKRCRGWVSA